MKAMAVSWKSTLRTANITRLAVTLLAALISPSSRPPRAPKNHDTNQLKSANCIDSEHDKMPLFGGSRDLFEVIRGLYAPPLQEMRARSNDEIQQRVDLSFTEATLFLRSFPPTNPLGLLPFFKEQVYSLQSRK